MAYVWRLHFLELQQYIPEANELRCLYNSIGLSVGVLWSFVTYNDGRLYGRYETNILTTTDLLLLHTLLSMNRVKGKISHANFAF